MYKFFAFIAAVCLMNGLTSADETRPNILWLSTEDIGPELACYGDFTAKTPHLDALAKKGMVYDIAWSNYPVCAPARTTIITGMYAAANGAGNMRSSIGLSSSIRMFPQYLREAGYYCTNNSKEDYNHPKPSQVWDESSRKGTYKNRKKGQPFFAVFNYTGTHESRIRSGGHKQVIDPASVKLKSYWPDTPEVRKDWAQYYDNIQTMDGWVARQLKELEESGEADNTIVVFFGDHGSGMPRHKRFAGDSGLLVPFVVYVPEKLRKLAPGGYKAGRHTSHAVGFVDLAPSMLSIAGIEPPAHMMGHAFIGAHQGSAPRYQFGYRDRMDERPDMSRSARDGRYIYVRNFMPYLPAGQEVGYQFQTPTTRIWNQLFQAGKLNKVQAHFWNPHPPEELYDLKADREETRNLSAHPRYAGVIARFRRALRDHTLNVRDAGFMPESEVLRVSRKENVREFVLDEAKYPMAAIYDAAQVAAGRDLEDLPELVKLAKSENPVIRYWSAVGFITRGEKAVNNNRELLLSMLDDSSPSPVVVAAEALAKFTEGSSRQRALQALLKSSDMGQTDCFVALHATNAIDRLGSIADPILDSVLKVPGNDKTVNRGGGYVARMLQHLKE